MIRRERAPAAEARIEATTNFQLFQINSFTRQLNAE
jgi:hypothetical protein